MQWSSTAAQIIGNVTNKYLTLGTSGTEAMRIVSTGYIGIGTSAPSTTLTVQGSSASIVSLFRTATSGHAVIEYANPSYAIYAGDAARQFCNRSSHQSQYSAYLTIKNSSGNVGIGQVTPTTNLEVSGTVSATHFAASGSSSFNTIGSSLIAATGISITTNQTSVTTLYASGAVQLANYGAGTLTTDASGNVTASSDERLKDIQGGFTRGLEAITALNPILYRWNEKSSNDMSATYAGFSAQDVQKAIPEAVSTDQRGYLTLSDRPIEAAMVNAIKELKAANDNLKAANDDLKKRLDSQQRDIEVLKKHAGIH
ncbi:tail fiber domain-containing protein [Bradyrhizobium sp. NC92]|uniref:tail fiber domain-containing protein n=1 Tax=Bradyrhizobium sp. (strain NC92) TaxID=55395 RepID=UPI0021A9F297|nr:tail fiber domain-containing protein [Bradyrhizobium sp. NC92]UWU68197.1 tail fiber domain-containing protein [Bradyrhizobium sp. NC92]